jgi:dUTP pyrophosphatase
MNKEKTIEKLMQEIEDFQRKYGKKQSIKVKLDDGAYMPTRAHDDDAGYDLYSRETVWLEHHSSHTFDTGVHIQIPKNYVGMVKGKSSLNIKCDTLCEGVIDCGYTGSIRVKLYNHGGSGYYISEGQKIGQLVIMPIITPELVQVDELEATERGDGGFGSTGKF